MRSKAQTALTAPLVLHHTRIYKSAMKKIIINGQMRNKPFLIVIYRSSLVKAAMNAAPVCKLRDGVNKTPQFLLFQWPKAKQRPLRTCQLWRDRVFEAYIDAFTIVNCGMKKKDSIQVRNEYSRQLSILFYNWQLKNKEALKYFEGLWGDGGQADFSENLPLLSL